VSEPKERAERYLESVGAVLEELKLSCSGAEEEKVKAIIETVRNYREDGEYFLKHGDVANGLAAVCYAEGILDALRLMGVIEFQWPGHHIA